MNTTDFQVQANPQAMIDIAHLSDEQIDDHLIGDLDGVGSAHLAECDQCAQRVAEAFEPMATFRDVTMSWSERRSATMPIPVIEADALVWQRRARWAMTACALVVGVSFVSNGRRADLLRASDQATQTSGSTTARTVGVPAIVAQRAEDEGTPDAAGRYSGDNRMLKAIDSELDASVETPAAMGLETVSGQTRSQGAIGSVQD